MRKLLIPTCLAILAFSGTALAERPVCYDWEEADYVPEGSDTPVNALSWWSVNNNDVFVGNYLISATETALVIYDSREGTYEEFTVPGAGFKTVGRINDAGWIAGQGMDGGWGPYVSFVRSPEGEITYLMDDFVAMDINNANEIAGYFDDDNPSYYWHGAVLSGEDWSDIEYYDVAGSDYSALWANNDAGDVVFTWEMYPDFPWYVYGLDVLGDEHGVQWFDWAEMGEGWDYGSAWGLNSTHVVVGNVYNSDYSTYEVGAGFIRNGSSYRTYVHEGTSTQFLDINDAGVIAATYERYDKGLIGWPTDCRK